MVSHNFITQSPSSSALQTFSVFQFGQVGAILSSTKRKNGKEKDQKFTFLYVKNDKKYLVYVNIHNKKSCNVLVCKKQIQINKKKMSILTKVKATGKRTNVQ